MKKEVHYFLLLKNYIYSKTIMFKLSLTNFERKLKWNVVHSFYINNESSPNKKFEINRHIADAQALTYV